MTGAPNEYFTRYFVLTNFTAFFVNANISKYKIAQKSKDNNHSRDDSFKTIRILKDNIVRARKRFLIVNPPSAKTLLSNRKWTYHNHNSDSDL